MLPSSSLSGDDRGFSGSSRHYSNDKPLLYEDSWEKWPYAFLNDYGEPDGFNVELVRRAMARLHIPVEVSLLNQEKVHDDLTHSKADLSLGVKVIYNDAYGHYGKETVCQFTNGMLVHRADSTGIITREELRNRHIVLRHDSRPLHYLRDLGFPDSLFTIVYSMESEILREAAEGTDGAVWNTMMMNWVLSKYHLNDRYVVVPIEMPAGDYRFMSHDTLLLGRLDSVLRIMKVEGEIDRMLVKWNSPEKKAEHFISPGYAVVVFCVMIVVIIALAAVRRYRRYRSHSGLEDVCTLMSLVMQSNNIKVWVYYPQARHYAWMSDNGYVDRMYSSFDFSSFYPDGNFNIIHNHVKEMLLYEKDTATEMLRCCPDGDPSHVCDMEVLIRRFDGDSSQSTIICGVQYDVSNSKARLNRLRLLRERYYTAFRISQGTLMRYDGDGRLTDVNETGRLRQGIDNVEAFVAEGYTIYDMPLLREIDIADAPADLRFTTHVVNADMLDIRYANSKHFNPPSYAMPGYYSKTSSQKPGARAYHEGYYYVHLIKNMSEDGRVLSYMLYIYDRTSVVQAAKSLYHKRQHINSMNDERKELYKRRAYTIGACGIRMLRFYPDKKELHVFSNSGKKVRSFSQISLLELVDSSDIKQVFNVFHKLDTKYRGNISLDVKTNIRTSSGENRHLRFDAQPAYDEHGDIMWYFGTCRDITEEYVITEQLKEETRKACEAELLKQNFLKNTSYSIRNPLVTIRHGIQRLGAGVTEEVEREIVGGITSNTRRLLTIMDDTLMYSRIEAGLMQLSPEVHDFVPFFKQTVNETLESHYSANVSYNVPEVYDHLVLSFDHDVMARILKEAVSLSARYTRVGTLSVRYLYSKGVMSLQIEDTGLGIPPNIFSHIYTPRIGDSYSMQDQPSQQSGLEMPICKALVQMMGGTIDIDSIPGSGTHIYISLPVEEVENKDILCDEEGQKKHHVG